MIKNFEEVKRQLIELSDAVNRFKSETVQLRIVELVLGAGTANERLDQEPDTERQTGRGRRKARKVRKAGSRASTTENSSDKRKLSKAGTGARALIVKFIEDGWFKQKRRIGDIVEHCSTKGKKLKASDISGKLIALVREEKLQRAKDAEGQWEYFGS
jgi:hypothetical protein